jgi:hypothetical protein
MGRLIGSGTTRIIIPGLAGSPDIKSSGSEDDEFDQNGSGTPSGWTLFGGNSPSARTDIFKSHLQIAAAAATSHSVNGIIKAKANPTTFPWTVIAKLNDCDVDSNYGRCGLFIADAITTNKLDTLSFSQNGDPTISETYFSNWTTFGSILTGSDVARIMPIYFKMVVHAANNIDMYCSYSGMAWVKVKIGASQLASATHVGLFVGVCPGPPDPQHAFFDWIRFS